MKPLPCWVDSSGAGWDSVLMQEPWTSQRLLLGERSARRACHFRETSSTAFLEFCSSSLFYARCRSCASSYLFSSLEHLGPNISRHTHNSPLPRCMFVSVFGSVVKQLGRTPATRQAVDPKCFACSQGEPTLPERNSRVVRFIMRLARGQGLRRA